MRIKLILIMGFVVFMTSCQERTKKDSFICDAAVVIANHKDQIPSDSNQWYFPVSAFYDTAFSIGSDTADVDRYSKVLFALNEPVLFKDTSDIEIFRFTRIPTWDNPVAIRIEKQGDCYFLSLKLCNGTGGYGHGTLSINKVQTITKAQWDLFIDYLTRSDFWDLPTIEHINGKDGAQWILEGKVAGNYHVVDRWSPDEKSNYYKVCNYLFELAKVPMND